MIQIEATTVSAHQVSDMFRLVERLLTPILTKILEANPELVIKGVEASVRRSPILLSSISKSVKRELSKMIVVHKEEMEHLTNVNNDILQSVIQIVRKEIK
jgi:hypothetical protein